ncbi:MAG: RNA-binding S4 domain-containing protein [Clostridia bacterium]|nr:RNA-binding S4 domain-containing protein [Clostridia bacterium]
MRLDKYLKVSRLIKRRTVACEACEQGKVTVNGKVAKPSANVSEGDVIAITFGEKTVTVRVEKVVEHALKADASDMYTQL